MSVALLLFRSTHDVIRAERSCLDAGIAVQVIPVPRDISSECGMALEIDERRLGAARSLLESAGIVPRVHQPG